TWARRLVWGLSIGVLVLTLFALVAVLFFSDRVIGPSMLPGLHAGDRALINPLAYVFGTPQRGDVVEVIPPAGPRDAAVKRLVGPSWRPVGDPAGGGGPAAPRLHPPGWQGGVVSPDRAVPGQRRGSLARLLRQHWPRHGAPEAIYSAHGRVLRSRGQSQRLIRLDGLRSGTARRHPGQGRLAHPAT